MPNVNGQVEVLAGITARVRALCLALPEVTVRVDYSLTTTRSTAESFDIRRRSFCLLVARDRPTGEPVPMLVVRADPDEREALLSGGRPFFAPRAGRDRLGVFLTDDTDWQEIRELATESYRVLAPKKLTALLDEQPFGGGRRTTAQVLAGCFQCALYRLAPRSGQRSARTLTLTRWLKGTTFLRGPDCGTTCHPVRRFLPPMMWNSFGKRSKMTSRINVGRD
jgi:hypothetical protein